MSDLQPSLKLPANPNYRPAIVRWGGREEERLSRWARPATVLNSYSLLTGLRQRAVNAACLFAAFITLPYHCLRRPVHGTCSRKMQIFEASTMQQSQKFECKIWKEAGEEVIRFHSRRQFNCS